MIQLVVKLIMPTDNRNRLRRPKRARRMTASDSTAIHIPPRQFDSRGTDGMQAFLQYPVRGRCWSWGEVSAGVRKGGREEGRSVC